ncbi:MAG: hypothetical protein O3B01_08610 [Planctomycetota bacterium]|nr:hypothetical protein [Planctomycetota bacterium]
MITPFPRVTMRQCICLVALLALEPSAWAGPVVSVPVPDDLKNPWPAEWEKEFQARAERVLNGMCAKEKAAGLGGRTYFESEKRAYGFLMAHALAGTKDVAIKELQKEDVQAKEWHSQTSGIDYYACFTIKHQMRKYFLFGDKLDPAYKKRMFDGAKAWTEKDPLRRPHAAFVKAGDGWGPDVKNSWVDVRSTENLFLMRVSSVYLMAEETGNEDTRKLYKDTILKYAAALYRVGMGEWDSENYHGHSIAPLLNLFDFAKDKEVKAAAKACLDYTCAIGAVKYYRGAFNGPTNRDYNHPQPFGGSAPCILWLYFGDTPLDNNAYESDEIHVLSSGYRPPAAVVHLARKNFDRPTELFASKPMYSATTGNDLKSPPEYFETQFFGRTFQMGSLVVGTTAGKSAVNGFKIVATDNKRGAIALQAVPGPDPKFAGSAKYTEGKVSGENRVGQNGSVAVWLVAGGESPWVWVLPEGVGAETEGGVTFLTCGKTWVALHPINAGAPNLNDELTKTLTAGKGDGRWAGHRVLLAKGSGGKFCGVAVEVGEAPEFADFAAFKKASLAKAKVTAAELDAGEAEFTGAVGKRVGIRFASARLDTVVRRDGKTHDWAEHGKHLYRSAGDKAVIEQAWLGGTLTVRAGKSVFTAAVSEAGAATFKTE